MDESPVRKVQLKNLFNFRDLGGYRSAEGRTVRWRTVFRSDGLHRSDDHDRQVLAELGLRTVLDLRTTEEQEEHGTFPYQDFPTGFHHLPLLTTLWDKEDLRAADLDPARYLADRYLDMTIEGDRSIATGLEVIAEASNRPVAFHCSAGKDRTGVLAATLLTLLGVPEDAIAHDYGLTRHSMTLMVEWVRQNVPEGEEIMADQPPTFLASLPAAIRLFLREMKARHGSVEQYALDLGVQRSVIEKLRAELLV